MTEKRYFKWSSEPLYICICLYLGLNPCPLCSQASVLPTRPQCQATVYTSVGIFSYYIYTCISLLVKEESIWQPDQRFVHPQCLDVVVVCRVPHQVLVCPRLVNKHVGGEHLFPLVLQQTMPHSDWTKTSTVIYISIASFKLLQSIYNQPLFCGLNKTFLPRRKLSP